MPGLLPQECTVNAKRVARRIVLVLFCYSSCRLPIHTLTIFKQTKCISYNHKIVQHEVGAGATMTRLSGSSRLDR